MTYSNKPTPQKIFSGRQSHYATRLAKINKEHNVVSSQDIYNDNGLLIVRKDTPITHEMAERILHQRLLQPLEEQVKIENALTADDLRDGIKKLMDKYPDIMQINYVLEFQETLDRLCNGTRYPVLLQELTVMSECLPEEYEKTIFCAWLSALIAKELEMKEDQIRAAFLSGLAHDIGLLHISPDILHKKETLTPEEWRALQSHVVIGHLLLKSLEGEDSLAATAVLEHHERCDGSGYPVGKTDEQLHLIGQIVGMSDSMLAIRINQFAKCGRNLRDALPYLHMNSHVHFLKVYKAMCFILLKSRLSSSRSSSPGNIRAFLSHLTERGRKLKDAAGLLGQAMDLAKTDASGFCSKIMKAAQPVEMMIKSSGLVEERIFAWLEVLQDENDKSALDDLMDIELMQNELYWHFRKIAKVTNDCLDRGRDVISPEHKKQLEYISSQLSGLNL